MKSKKLVFSAVVVLCLLSFTIGIVLAQSNLIKIEAFIDPSVKMVVNGNAFEPKETNGSPLYAIFYKERYYLPVRPISEANGLAVNWDDKTRTVTLLKDNGTVNVDFAKYQDFVNTMFTKDSDKLKTSSKTYAWGITNTIPLEYSDTFWCYVKPQNSYKKLTTSVYISDKASKEQRVEFRKENQAGEMLKSITIMPGETKEVEVDITGSDKVAIIVPANQGGTQGVIIGEPVFGK